MADDEAKEEDEWLYGETVTADDLAKGLGEPIVKHPKGTKRKITVTGEEEGDGEDDDDSQLEDVREGGESNRGVMTEDQEQEGEADLEAGGGNEGEGEDISDNDDDEDDDDSDDGVQVVIGDLKSGSSQGAGFTPKRPGPPPDKKGKFASEDFEATGTINGVPAQDFSLDSIEEKPWRKPGADITDYFNYGFTEETWRAYCDRQKRVRYESGATYSAISTKGGQQGSQVDSKSGIVFPKKFNTPGDRKSGIGMGQGAVRREEPKENTIQVRVVMTADRREYGRKNFDNMNMGPPMIPPPPFNMNLPPPPFPPPEFMGGEFFNHPPPGYYQDEEPGYDDQQWMDSQWEMGMEGSGVGPSPSVVPLTKVAVVPPPPGETDDDSTDLPPSQKNESSDK